MQGQRGTIGPFSEAFNFNNGSTSSSIDQPVCWDNMQTSAENHLSDYILSPGDIGITYMDPVGQEQQSTNRWCFGEPSSSGIQNEVDQDEQKTDNRWSSSLNSCLRNGSRLERGYEQSNHLSSESLNGNQIIMQSSNAVETTQNLNLNADFMICDADNSQPNICESSGTENEEAQPASAPELSSLPSGSGGFLVQEIDGRLDCSLDGRRASCKRKSLEGNIGQSSVCGSGSGNSSYLQNAETSALAAVPSNGNGSSLSISAMSEQVDPGINLGVEGAISENLHNSSAAGTEERSQRNFRARVSSSSQPESSQLPPFPIGNSVRLPSVSSSRQSRLTPAPRPGSTSTHTHPIVIPVPAMPRNVQPFRWNGISVSRPGSSSSSVVSRNRDAAREGSSSRRVERNILEHPRFIPAADLRNFSQNPTNRSLVGGSLSIPGNIALSTQTGSSSVPASAPSWVSHTNPPRYSRRLSEYVRRSLFSPIDSEAGGQDSDTNSLSPLHSGPPSQELLIAPGTGNQDRHQSNRRSALWMERQGDGVLAIPYSLRNLAASGEGRSGRLVSEQIRNVLDLVRRGEGFRFEDVMILDQSVLFGVADIHDRHRDMRLDVDNMSYEELLALEERIGDVSTGLSEETILKQLKQWKYSTSSSGSLEAEPCCVCQEEYTDGEDIGTLDCGHDFHKDCVKQWLMHKNLCPICKTTGLTS